MSFFKTIVGQAAEGDYYFPREEIDGLFWKYISKGNHLLLSAPRRVGKTSFLKHISNASSDTYLIKYHTTESINSGDDFFKKLYKSLVEEMNQQKSTSVYLKGLFKSHGIKQIGIKGIELTKSDLDYFQEFKRLVSEVKFGKKFVFIIDEFSETLENIILDQDEQAGKIFLHQNRELRQESAINQKMQFVYSGSIGLGNIAGRISAIKAINDVFDLAIEPLSHQQALVFVQDAIISDDLRFPEEVREYLLKRVEWWIPFYIQILLDEIENHLLEHDQSTINEAVIDAAIIRALQVRSYFEHWLTQLRVAFKGNAYTFSRELLNQIASVEGGINKSQVFDLASKLDIEDSYSSIVRTLIHDGYIQLDDAGQYRFNSPLLKIWWGQNIPI